jgi:hypothetical protein
VAENITRLQRSLDWLSRNREKFSFQHGPSAKDKLALLKPFAEYLLIHSVLNRNPVLSRQLRADAEWAWKECANGESILSMLQARPDLFELVTVCGSFSALGFRNPQLDQWLQVLFHANGRAGELPSWRRVALSFHLAQLGLIEPEMHLDPTSWLAALPEPWIISEERLYALTHQIFYLTDFGRYPERADEAVTAYIELWLPVWAARAKAEANLDLLGELLLVALYLQQHGNVTDLTDDYLDAQADDGSFPGPPAGSGTLARFSVLSDQTFYSVYHPTLVGTLFLAAGPGTASC